MSQHQQVASWYKLPFSRRPILDLPDSACWEAIPLGGVFESQPPPQAWMARWDALPITVQRIAAAVGADMCLSIVIDAILSIGYEPERIFPDANVVEEAILFRMENPSINNPDALRQIMENFARLEIAGGGTDKIWLMHVGLLFDDRASSHAFRHGASAIHYYMDSCRDNLRQDEEDEEDEEEERTHLELSVQYAIRCLAITYPIGSGNFINIEKADTCAASIVWWQEVKNILAFIGATEPESFV